MSLLLLLSSSTPTQLVLADTRKLDITSRRGGAILRGEIDTTNLDYTSRFGGAVLSEAPPVVIPLPPTYFFVFRGFIGLHGQIIKGEECPIPFY